MREGIRKLIWAHSSARRILVNMLMHKLKLLIPRALAGAKFDFVMEKELLILECMCTLCHYAVRQYLAAAAHV